jgi:uncharacterized protein YbjT (DUF2867 family)
MHSTDSPEPQMHAHDVFVTGATGYIGRFLIGALLGRGHRVRALVRRGSEAKVPAGALSVHGDALEGASYRDSVAPADTFVHLVGTPHPAPWKARQFREVDLRSIEAAVDAARHARVQHFVYLSVAHPAPVMAAYIAVRRKGEALLAQSGISATMVRPWYVLGPGHRWPALLLPVYALLERIPTTRETALRLGLVTLEDIVAALVRAVEHPPETIVAIGVPEIRGAQLKASAR